MARSASKLPHWDNVLAEASWMAVDFRQELRWKITTAQALSHLCASTIEMQKGTKDVSHKKRLRMNMKSNPFDGKAVASRLSSSIRMFWDGIGKIIDDRSDENPTKSFQNGLKEIQLRRNASFLDFRNSLKEFLEKLGNASIGFTRKYVNGKVVPSNSFNFDSLKSDYSCEFSSEVDTQYWYINSSLLSHQVIAAKRILKANSAGVGCALYGKPCTGKTAILASLAYHWLVKENNNRQYSTNEVDLHHTAVETVTHSCNFASSVLLFLPRKHVVAWASELQRRALDCTIQVWAPDDQNSVIPSANIVICIVENLGFYLKFLQLCENIESKICGVIIDFREDGNLAERFQRINYIQSSFKRYLCQCLLHAKNWLSLLASIIPRSIRRRCIVADESFYLDIDNLPHVLNFLVVPQYRSSDFPTGFDASNDSFAFGNSHMIDKWQHWVAEEIKVCVDQTATAKQTREKYLDLLMSIISVEVSLSSAVNAIATAQTREEILAYEMDALQEYKYKSAAECLLQHRSFGGENPWVFAQAVSIMKRVCFHEAMVSISSPMPPKPSIAQFASDTSRISISIGSSSSSLRPLDFINPDVSDARSSRLPHSPLRTGSRRRLLRLPGCFSSGPLVPHLANSGSRSSSSCRGGGDYVAGSCKLRELEKLLSRFEGLRIVILVASPVEMVLVSHHLRWLGKDHSRAGSSRLDSPMSWLQAQAVVNAFNKCPSAAPGLMIALCDVFRPQLSSPSSLPSSSSLSNFAVIPLVADVVIVLSDDWMHPTDIKRCFCLRLNSAGPVGDPVTIVRVVAKGTVDESIARSLPFATSATSSGISGSSGMGRSLVAMQGQPLRNDFKFPLAIHDSSDNPSMHRSDLRRFSAGSDFDAMFGSNWLEKAPSFKEQKINISKRLQTVTKSLSSPILRSIVTALSFDSASNATKGQIRSRLAQQWLAEYDMGFGQAEAQLSRLHKVYFPPFIRPATSDAIDDDVVVHRVGRFGAISALASSLVGSSAEAFDCRSPNEHVESGDEASPSLAEAVSENASPLMPMSTDDSPSVVRSKRRRNFSVSSSSSCQSELREASTNILSNAISASANGSHSNALASTSDINDVESPTKRSNTTATEPTSLSNSGSSQTLYASNAFVDQILAKWFCGSSDIINANAISSTELAHFQPSTPISTISSISIGQLLLGAHLSLSQPNIALGHSQRHQDTNLLDLPDIAGDRSGDAGGGGGAEAEAERALQQFISDCGFCAESEELSVARQQLALLVIRSSRWGVCDQDLLRHPLDS